MSRSALALVILVAFLEAKTKKMVARLWGGLKAQKTQC